MKKLAFLLAAVMSVSVIFAGCKDNVNPDNPVNPDETTVSAEVTGGGDVSLGDVTEVPDTEPTIEGIMTPPATEEPVVIDPDDIFETEPPVNVPTVSNKRYAYENLSADDKSVYEKILKGAMSFKSTVKLDKPITQKKMAQIFCLVYFEEPQLFWLRGAYDSFDGTTDTVSLYYKYDNKEAKEIQAKIDAKTNQILSSFPANASTVDKLKVIHDHIALNCDFTKSGNNVTNIYGGLIDGFVQCEGYAKTMGYLCDKAGIDNMLVPGADKDGFSHAWTVVKVNNEWYNMDVTWDDPMNKPDKTYVRYNYFLVTDAEIINKSHFPDTSYFTAPKCTATAANYQRTYGLYAESVDQAKKILASELKKASDGKITQVQIKCSSLQVLRDLKKDLITDKKLIDLLNNNNGKNKFKLSQCDGVADENVLTFQIRMGY